MRTLKQKNSLGQLPEDHKYASQRSYQRLLCAAQNTGRRTESSTASRAFTPTHISRLTTLTAHLGSMKRPGPHAIDSMAQIVGGLATCLLAGSCLQEVVSEPDVGVLVYAGHVDVLSAKVCTFPERAVDHIKGPAVIDPQVHESPPIVSYGRPAVTRPAAEQSNGDSLRAFLQEGRSLEKDEASCLSSASYDEGRSTRELMGQLTIDSTTASDQTRGGQGNSDVRSKQSDKESAEELASMEIDEEEEREIMRLRLRQRSRRRRRRGCRARAHRNYGSSGRPQQLMLLADS